VVHKILLLYSTTITVANRSTPGLPIAELVLPIAVFGVAYHSIGVAYHSTGVAYRSIWCCLSQYWCCLSQYWCCLSQYWCFQLLYSCCLLASTEWCTCWLLYSIDGAYYVLQLVGYNNYVLKLIRNKLDQLHYRFDMSCGTVVLVAMLTLPLKIESRRSCRYMVPMHAPKG